MKRLIVIAAAVAGMASSLAMLRSVAAGTPVSSKAQEVLSRAAEQQEYTFILFHKENNTATKTMAQTLKDGIAKREGQATFCFVSTTDPAEKAVVERFGVARAAMPLTVAVAPNGAVTGIFLRKLTESNLAGAFVTPMMADCLKSMQDGKLVMVCVHASAENTLPAAVDEFRADTQFKDRLAVISLQTSDAAETQFLSEMEIDPAKAKDSIIVFFAPPGVLVGKFGTAATKDEMAAALHKAGKCCNDPNCKHGKADARQANQSSGAKRN